MIDYKQVDIEFADTLYILKKEGKITLERLKDEFAYSDILIQRLRQDQDIRINKNTIEYARITSKDVKANVVGKPVAHKQPLNKIKKLDPELEIALDDVLYRLKYNNRLTVAQVKALYPQSPNLLIDALNKSHKAKCINGYYYRVL